MCKFHKYNGDCNRPGTKSVDGMILFTLRRKRGKLF